MYFILIGLLYRFTAVTSEELPPQIDSLKVLDPVPIQNVVGREVLRLLCSVTGNPVPTIQWSLNGVLLKPASSSDALTTTSPLSVFSRVQINGGEFTLINVNGLTDSGRYRCIATNNYGTTFVEQNIQIRVLGKFNIGNQYHDEPRKFTPTIGRSFIITCPPHKEAGYGTKYRWGVVPRESREPQYWRARNPAIRGFPVSGGKFAYSYVTSDDIKESRDVGGIRCILFNFGVFVASNQQLLWQPYETVEESRKPNLIEHFPAAMNAVVDTEYILSCGALGKPLPKIFWVYQGIPIKSRFNGSSELNFEFFRIIDGNLYIRRITIYSGGTFECVAKNALGNVRKIGQLTVQVPPKWIANLPAVKSLTLGSRWSFYCNASGVPQPTYEWYHNMTLIENSVYRKVEGGVMTLISARFADNGVFVCLAIHPLKTLTSSVYVEIKEKSPQFEIPLKDINYVFRLSISYIHCKIIGGPLPTITWSKNGNNIGSNDRFLIFDNGTLRIKGVLKSDEGLYQCKGENSLGMVSMTTTIKILEPTIINHPPQNVTFNVAWKYGLIFCGATFDKLLDLRIDWYKEGIKMQKLGGRVFLETRAYGPPRVLHFNDFEITDGVRYSCHAYTEIDDVISEQWAHAKVTIRGAPLPPGNVRIEGDCSSYNAVLRWRRGEQLSIEVRRYYIEFATNASFHENKWYGGEGPPKLDRFRMVAEPGTIRNFDLNKANLLPGANLIFRMRAASDLLIGDASGVTFVGSCITPNGPPRFNPSNVSIANNGSGRFVIVWKPLDEIFHGAPGFLYKVAYKKQSSGEFTTVEIANPNQSSYEVPSPGIYEPYMFYVQSKNSIGDGPTPDIKNGRSGRPRPTSVPGNIRIVLILKYSVEFRWSPVSDADGYKIVYWNVTDSEDQRGFTPQRLLQRKRREVSPLIYRSQIFIGGEYSNGVSLSNLTADQDFMATVAAVNRGGVGPESQVIEFRTKQRVPSVPTQVSFQTFGKSVWLQWNPPLYPNGFIEEYLVFWHKTHPNDNTQDGPIQLRSFTRNAREAYLLDVLEPLTYYNIKLSARNREGPGKDWERILVAVSADDVPGKPNPPVLIPYDDTAVNVTFQNSGYGGLPNKFIVRVRPKGNYYGEYTTYEQVFPQRAWLLVTNLKRIIYDIHCIGVNSLGISETSDVVEFQPIQRPKFEARAALTAWWSSNWMVLFCLCASFIIILAATLIILLCNRKHIKIYPSKSSGTKKKMMLKDDEEPLINPVNLYSTVQKNESKPPPYKERKDDKRSYTDSDERSYTDQRLSDSESYTDKSMSESGSEYDSLTDDNDSYYTESGLSKSVQKSDIDQSSFAEV